ncbi:MAG: addiction module protein [Luteolibacter sp.]
MSSASEIQDLALRLPKRSRLKLAGELLRSVSTSSSSADVLEEAVRREAEIESGKVKPLTESEFWAGVS